MLLQDSTASYVYGPGGMLLEEVVDGHSYYYHADQLGSVRAITDESGDTVASYTYDAYGNPISSSSQVYNPFGYTGEYTDSESGLIYLRARYYDPSTRQFLTRDPIEDITGQAYNYAAGNPTNFRDPSGKFVPIQVLCPECVVVSTVAGGLIGLGAYALFHQGCFDLVEAAK
ncbi:MAG: RHS repeat-associated core domain-containing protein, partial [Chloroflexia bacterium]